MSKIHTGQNVRIGHLNVYHLANKVTDINVFLNTPSHFHVFGITETRLGSHISDDIVAVPNYSIIRKDQSKQRETGVAAYIHDSIQHLIRRRVDLETDKVECIWIELKHKKTTPLLICMLYRNPASTFEWYDNFLCMIDRIDIPNNDILLLGDFNIDMLKSHTAWDSTITMLGLKQLVSTPTRVTATSATIVDHILYGERKGIHVGGSNLRETK